ncbi:MAG: ABC transporter ATP-binding protein [Lachnospiraceae bacterium]|nr:ABC transporter ATP-binding protein [Lachnospiraceae bacterium]
MVEVRNLSMSYGKKEVLKDVSFQIDNGKTIGLLGSNGAGKSTTMNILTGYLKPQQGDVIMNGVNMSNNPKQAKKMIGYLPEIPPLYKDMKVREYLIFVAQLKGLVARDEEVDNVLQLMNLEEIQYDFIKKLSKGMQQRVGFAQAMLGKPEILILDEPLVGLDPIEAKRTRELIKSLKGNHSVIISSHVLKEIEELCDFVLILKDGKVVLNDSTSDVKKKGNKDTYRIVVKGVYEEITDIIKNYDGIQSFSFVREQEKDVYEFLLKAKNTRDMRDKILGYLANKRVSVYAIERTQASLEDVYIQLNEQEEK